jgi:hypothetical protein
MENVTLKFLKDFGGNKFCGPMITSNSHNIGTPVLYIICNHDSGNYIL